MKRLIMMALAGMVFFGGSAAASFMLRDQLFPKPESEAEDEGALANQPLMVPEPASPMPVTTLGEEGISAATVLSLSESIKQRESELMVREEEAVRNESRLSFLLNDMQREKQEIRALLDEMDLLATQTEQLVERVERSPLSPETSESPPATGEVRSIEEALSAEEIKNLKTVATWLQGMKPEGAAETIRKMCNEGKIDMVVRLLGYFEESQAAKVMEALKDPVLFGELVSRFQNLNRETAQ